MAPLLSPHCRHFSAGSCSLEEKHCKFRHLSCKALKQGHNAGGLGLNSYSQNSKSVGGSKRRKQLAFFPKLPNSGNGGLQRAQHSLLLLSLQSNGWEVRHKVQKEDEREYKEAEFGLFFSCKQPSPLQLALLPRNCRLLHGGSSFFRLSHKDLLPLTLHTFAAAVRQAKGAQKEEGRDTLLDFFPKHFVLPAELPLLSKALEENPPQISTEAKAREADLDWIIKPYRRGGGKKVRVVLSEELLKELKEGKTLTHSSIPAGASVVSRYIPNPLLIGGFKVDLRLYVLVASFSPLRVFVHREGMVRFAGASYSSNARIAHVTNNTVAGNGVWRKEKERPDTGDGGEEVVGGAAANWSLTLLRNYIDQRFSSSQPAVSSSESPWEMVWRQVERLVTVTIASVVTPCLASLEKSQKALQKAFPLSELAQARDLKKDSFELFGFDVLIDEKLKCWLLEVNDMPDWGDRASHYQYAREVEHDVKAAVLADAWSILLAGGGESRSQPQVSTKKPNQTARPCLHTHNFMCHPSECRSCARNYAPPFTLSKSELNFQSSLNKPKPRLSGFQDVSKQVQELLQGLG